MFRWLTDSDWFLKLQQEARLRQQQIASIRRPIHEHIVPQIKMFVSNWYTDELGNQARIIKAHD